MAAPSRSTKDARAQRLTGHACADRRHASACPDAGVNVYGRPRVPPLRGRREYAWYLASVWP